MSRGHSDSSGSDGTGSGLRSSGSSGELVVSQPSTPRVLSAHTHARRVEESPITPWSVTITREQLDAACMKMEEFIEIWWQECKRDGTLGTFEQYLQGTNVLPRVYAVNTQSRQRIERDGIPTQSFSTQGIILVVDSHLPAKDERTAKTGDFFDIFGENQTLLNNGLVFLEDFAPDGRPVLILHKGLDTFITSPIVGPMRSRSVSRSSSTSLPDPDGDDVAVSPSLLHRITPPLPDGQYRSA